MNTWEALLSTVQVAQQLSCQSGGREERLSGLRGGGRAPGVRGAGPRGKDPHAQAPPRAEGGRAGGHREGHLGC